MDVDEKKQMRFRGCALLELCTLLSAILVLS